MDHAQAIVLRDPKGLSNWLTGALVIYAIVSIPLTSISIAFLHLSGGDPNYSPEDPIGALVALGLLAAIGLMVVVFLFCIVLTLRITHRMIKNLEALQSSYMRTGAVWATLSYFIPFANLFVPVQAVRQIWDGTFAALEGEPPKPPRGAIGWWWACWLIGNVADNIASRLSGDTLFEAPHQPTTAALESAMVLTGIGTLMNLLGAILMIRLFGTLAKAQSELALRQS